MSSQNIVVRRFKKQGVNDKINKERNCIGTGLRSG